MRAIFAVFALFALSALGGCAERKAQLKSGFASQSLASMNQSELEQAVDYWRAQYQRDSKSKEIGLRFAAALRRTNRDEQALAVMRQMAIKHSRDREVLADYGKALAGAGQWSKALDALGRAQTPDDPDWRLHSAAGAVLDQMGKPKEARIQYAKALDLMPDESSVLSNLGLSHLLEGNPALAESYLRKAVKQKDADSQVRQNLALVIGLQGRFAEAEKVAAFELPPDKARENIAFLREMLAARNSWSALKKEG